MANDTLEVTPADFAASSTTYFLVACVLIILYAALRTSRFFFTRVFYPLYPHEELTDYEKSHRKSRIAPPSNWISYLLRTEREKDVLETCGLDAYVTLRATKLPLLLFAFWGIFAFLFIVPAYAATGDAEEIITLISIGSVEAGEEDLLRWVFVSMLVFNAAIVLLVKREYEHFIKVKKDYLAKKSKERYSVVVERVPPKLMSKQRLERYFEAVIGAGTVHSVTLLPKVKLMKPLNLLIKKRTNLLLQLEMTQAANAKKQERKTIFTWETGFKETLNELKEFNLEVNAEPNDGTNIVSPTITNFLVSEKFRELEDKAKKELQGYMTSGKKFKAFVNTLTCGVRKSSYTRNGDAAVVDAEEYLTAKLETVNLLIGLLQQRASIVLDISTNTEEVEPVEPEFEEYTALLDTSERKLAKPEERITFRQKLKIFFNLEKPPATEEQRNLKEFSQYVHYAAVVTFDSKSAANVASVLAIDDVSDTLRTSFATKPADFKKDNVNYSVFSKTAVASLGIFLTILLIAFFASVVAFLGLLTNLEQLRGENDFLDDVIDFNNGIIVEALDQLSPFVLVIALNLVPPVLWFIYGLQKPVSDSDLQRQFFTGYYTFGVIQLFIFYQSSSAATAAFQAILDDPGAIIEILAEAIPNNAVFFMQFIMIKGFLGLPLELLRLVPIILGVCLRRSLTCKSYESETQRERDATKILCLSSPQKPVMPVLAKLNANTMLLYTIGISYCIIAPLMSIVCFGYCLLFTIIMRNQFIFVYAQDLKKMDSLGRHFEAIMDTFFIAILLLTLTMTGIFGLLEQAGAAAMGVPTIIIILLVRVYFNRSYSKELAALPLALAKLYDVRARADAEGGEKTDDQVGKEVADELDSLSSGDKFFDYRHPSLKAPAVETL